MNDVNCLTGMLCSHMRHYVRRLFATKFAVGTLKSRLLSTFVLQVSHHVSFGGEATSALGTSERFIGASHRRTKIIRRWRINRFTLVSCLRAVIVGWVSSRWALLTLYTSVITRIPRSDFFLVDVYVTPDCLQQMVQVQLTLIATWNFNICLVTRVNLRTYWHQEIEKYTKKNEEKYSR